MVIKCNEQKRGKIRKGRNLHTQDFDGDADLLYEIETQTLEPVVRA